MSYQSFLDSKRAHVPDSGFDVSPQSLNPLMKPFQRDVTRWALRKGRAAIFLDTGLGKTLVQLEWASQIHQRTGGNVLILAPLAVSRQTLLESAKFGITAPVKVQVSQANVEPGITITNYEKLHRFDPTQFVGVVLDESSILKSIDGKTKEQIIAAFAETPYRLACTATPAPNDQMELGNHAAFLGVMSQAEMLSMFFVHDGGNTSKRRLKGWAAESSFWKWMSSWAVMIRKPSDIGYDDAGYDLPPLNIHEHEVESDLPYNGRLFATEARTLGEQREARRDTIEGRVNKLATLTNANTREPWVVWCNLNAESTAAARNVMHAIEVTGSMKDSAKELALLSFIEQHSRAMVSKLKIAGFGLNLQFCNKMAFLGISHSYEQFYQGVRRIWRFGQGKPCDVHVIVSDGDAGVLANVMRKQGEHDQMAVGMIQAMAERSKAEIGSTRRESTEYNPQQRMEIPAWLK